jgi:hypothetical protein
MLAVLPPPAVGGVFDFIWQRQLFMERMKMTKEEVKEHFRQSEGAPHVSPRSVNSVRVELRPSPSQASGHMTRIQHGIDDGEAVGLTPRFRRKGCEGFQVVHASERHARRVQVQGRGGHAESVQRSAHAHGARAGDLTTVVRLLRRSGHGVGVRRTDGRERYTRDAGGGERSLGSAHRGDRNSREEERRVVSPDRQARKRGRVNKIVSEKTLVR